MTGREICGISGPCSVGDAFASVFFILHFEMDVLPVHCHLFLFKRGMVDLCWLKHVVLSLAMLEIQGALSYPGGNGYRMF